MSADWGATAGLLARTSLAMAVTAAMGVALAAIARNRAVVLVAALAWLALLEDLVGALLKVPELLPGAVVRALVAGNGGGDALGAGPAALLLLAIAVWRPPSRSPAFTTTSPDHHPRPGGTTDAHPAPRRPER
jgi:hypothetical protein